MARTEYHREYYQRNKAKIAENRKARRKQINEWQKRHAEANRAYVRELKEATPCADCGERFPYYVMDFDHQSDKFKNVSQMMARYSLDTLKAEIAKCEIVCANCHRLRHPPSSLY